MKINKPIKLKKAHEKCRTIWPYPYLAVTFSVLPRATGNAHTQSAVNSHLHFAVIQCTKPGKEHPMKRLALP